MEEDKEKRRVLVRSCQNTKEALLNLYRRDWKTFYQIRWTQFTYTERKRNHCFSSNGQTKFEHQHDSVCLGNCHDSNCNDDYFGETAREVFERIVDRNERDKKDWIYLNILMNEITKM